MERRTSDRLKKKAESRPTGGQAINNLTFACQKASSYQKSKVVYRPKNGISQVDSVKRRVGTQFENIAETKDGDKESYAEVQKTLRIYNSRLLSLVQKNQKAIAAGIPKAVKRKRTKTGEEVAKRTVNRFDLQASTEMREANEILYSEKRIGHLPGIDVGFRFYSRAEMVAVGFHSHWLNGIDTMETDCGELEKIKNKKFSVAVSIVISGQYEDDVDNVDEIWYTGQGGNDLNYSKRQCKDQKLAGGNLALKNSKHKGTPVRVIRGNKSGDKKCKKIYIYDGLYKVLKVVYKKGASGFKIYKFLLKREPDQPKLTGDQVKYMRADKPYTSKKFPGLVPFDIASGQEGIRVRAINTIDNTSPTGFTYTSTMQFADGIILPPNAKGCKCKGKCTDENSCACAKLNGNEFPYYHKGGRLKRPMDVVYECGPNCGCGPSCINRVSQRKLNHKLEVFKTQEKGWAVRSEDFIDPGALVCEYVGVLRKTEDVDCDTDGDYLFEIDCQQTMDGVGHRQRRARHARLPRRKKAKKDDKDPEYCIDGGPVGSVSRFINHSCQPNLFVQCVLSSHHDTKLARVVLFAGQSISPFEELTYDYNYALNSVADPDGRVIKLPCYCGAAKCRKRLY